MRLSRQQKVYLAILAVTCGGLVVDRLFLSGQLPASAGTSLPLQKQEKRMPNNEFRISKFRVRYSTFPGPQGEPNSQALGLGLGPARGGPDPNSPSPSKKLAQRLEILWQEEGLDLDEARDAFSLPPAWRASASAQNPMAGGNDTLRFASNHQLKAVLVDGKTCSAWVDNHLLILGQELDGFKLIAVDEDSATFAAGRKQVVLKLTDDR